MISSFQNPMQRALERFKQEQAAWRAEDALAQKISDAMSISLALTGPSGAKAGPNAALAILESAANNPAYAHLKSFIKAEVTRIEGTRSENVSASLDGLNLSSMSITGLRELSKDFPELTQKISTLIRQKNALKKVENIVYA